MDPENDNAPEDDDLRSAIDDSFGDEGAGEATETSVSESDNGDTGETGSGEESQASGKSSEGDGGESDAGSSDDVPAIPSVSGSKPPATWRATAREEWDKLPEVAKTEIIKREGDIARALNDSGRQKDQYDQLDAVFTPYEPLLQSMGMDRPAAIKNLLGTAYTMRTGTAHQKADVIAKWVSAFDIDVAVLDDVLTASLEGTGQPDPMQSQINNAVQQALAPVNQFMQNMQTQQTQVRQKTAEEITSEISTFSQNSEFYEDVRETMADIFEIAGKRGQNLTLQEAYDRATMMVPEVATAIQNRANEAKVLAQTAEAQDKLGRSVSISGGSPSNSGGGSVQNADDLRGLINEAYNAANG
jgi:hypothetical protein